MQATSTDVSRPRLHAVVISFVIMIAATQIGFIVQNLIDSDGFAYWGFLTAADRRILDFALLGFAGLLVCAAPRRSGLTLGTSGNRHKALLACLFVFAVAAAFRYVPLDVPGLGTIHQIRVRLLGGCPATTSWLVSPLAQEAIFSGFILGYLQPHFPRRLHRTLPVTGAVVITAILFGLWHLIPSYGFGVNYGWYYTFRFLYTAGGMMVYGGVRIWTGSIAYAVLTHTAVNFIYLTGFGCMVSGIGTG